MQTYSFSIGDKIIGYGETYEILDIYNDGMAALVRETWKSEDDWQYCEDIKPYSIEWRQYDDYATQVLIDGHGQISFYATNLA